MSSSARPQLLLPARQQHMSVPAASSALRTCSQPHNKSVNTPQLFPRMLKRVGMHAGASLSRQSTNSAKSAMLSQTVDSEFHRDSSLTGSKPASVRMQGCATSGQHSPDASSPRTRPSSGFPKPSSCVSRLRFVSLQIIIRGQQGQSAHPTAACSASPACILAAAASTARQRN